MEQKIQDVEADISKAENKVEIAADKGSSDELNYWRNKEHELRKKENLLREKEARMQAQQQGITLFSPSYICCYLHGRKSISETFSSGIMKSHSMLPKILYLLMNLELLWDKLTGSGFFHS